MKCIILGVALSGLIGCASPYGEKHKYRVSTHISDGLANKWIAKEVYTLGAAGVYEITLEDGRFVQVPIKTTIIEEMPKVNENNPM